MGEKIVVGPINKGLKNDRTAFVIDNDSFPALLNSYQWRGRAKRKRGTTLLNRLTRFFNSANSSYGSTASFNLVAGAGNVLTSFALQADGNIVPGSVHLTDATAGNVFTDNSLGVLTGAPAGTGTINYATGAITISGGAADLITTVTFRYTPDLPVMGLEDFDSISTQFPGTLGFDTKYSYNISTAHPYSIYDVSFYKNPPLDPVALPGYIPKTNITPTSWNGDDYQQFWTTNYQGSLWATNGINVPFDITKIGMQFKPITTVTVLSPTSATLAIVNHGLEIGDFVFINEVATTTGINFQTGYVTAIVANVSITVTFPNATIATNGTGGIAQYLTNRSDTTKDCLRWYDGDPTDGIATAPVLNGRLGWVNFMPPLSNLNYSISDLPIAQYYLVGARLIFPFKDRLLFLGPVVQTSSSGAAPIYLRDTIIYSQNGTPYYTSSFTAPVLNYPLNPSVINPILLPVNQTGTPSAYFEDITGFGGFVQAGIDQEILTVGSNEDVLIAGFTRAQGRLIYTGNDVIPFTFYLINSELGSGSSFSAVQLDEGIISKGSRGFIMTTQTNCQRIDLDIPDEVFQMNLPDNGTERVCSQRDFISEWIYFTYPVNSIPYKFPTQTLQYNYRDNSWGIFRESYTTYGTFRRRTGQTWATLPRSLTWESWNEPWESGNSTLLNPEVIAGNQQGFVLFRDKDGTSEGTSLYIQSIVGNIITSPDHCLNNGDYITISGALGTISTEVNGKIFSVVFRDDDTFSLNPPLSSGFTYLGLGLITRMYVPLIQSKQFPTSWGMGRKTRLGMQQYLLSTTENSQITLLIFLSQDGSNAFNEEPIVPDPNAPNPACVYSTVLYTCPESTNLGLTPANTNLQMPIGRGQQQIWHRVNTSLIGDTVQVGFTLSDAQMRDVNFNNQFEEIELHGFILDVNPSQLLA